MKKMIKRLILKIFGIETSTGAHQFEYPESEKLRDTHVSVEMPLRELIDFYNALYPVLVHFDSGRKLLLKMADTVSRIDHIMENKDV